MAKRIQQKPRKQRSLRGMARRGLSILMAMVMVISLIQISVFATGGDESLPVGEYHLIPRDDFWNYCETRSAEDIEDGHWVSALVLNGLRIEAEDGRETCRQADLTGGIDGYNVYADAKDGSGDIQPSEIAYVVLYGTYLDCYTWGIFDLPWADIISFEYKIPITEFNVQSYPDQWDTQAYAEITFKDSSETPDPETEYSATLNFTYGYEDETAQAVPQEAMTGFQLNDGQAVIAYPKSKIDTTWTDNGDGTYSKTLDIPDTITVNGVEYALEEGTSKTVTISAAGTTQDFYYSAQRPTTSYGAWFFLRNDGAIPQEDGSTQYTEDKYYPTHLPNDQTSSEGMLVGTVSGNAAWTNVSGVINEDGTINGQKLTEAFAAVQNAIITEPSDAAIQAVMQAAGQSYDPETQDVIWYVVKNVHTDGASQCCPGWHVDGIVFDKINETPDFVTLNYFLNASENETALSSEPYDKGTSVTVKGSSDFKNFANGDLTFVGWNTKADGTGTSYAAGSTFVLNADTNLYAQWEDEETPIEKTFSVNFQYVTDVADASQVPSGVTLPAALTAKEGETITFGQQSYGTGIIPDGYTFHGWYSDAACTTPVAEDQTFTEGATVYGYWTYTSGGGGGGTTYYTLTVKYLEDGTDEELAPAYTQSIAAGRSYDVTAQTQKTIDGYDISKVTGDDVSGFMSGNREIIVYYTVNIDDGETPLDPGPGGDGSGDGDTDIGDGEVPLDPGTGNGGDGTDIGDENVPLVPATGDNMALWVLAAVVSAAGLVYLTVTGKKREQENG